MQNYCLIDDANLDLEVSLRGEIAYYSCIFIFEKQITI